MLIYHTLSPHYDKMELTHKLTGQLLLDFNSFNMSEKSSDHFCLCGYEEFAFWNQDFSWKTEVLLYLKSYGTLWDELLIMV